MCSEPLPMRVPPALAGRGELRLGGARSVGRSSRGALLLLRRAGAGCRCESGKLLCLALARAPPVLSLLLSSALWARLVLGVSPSACVLFFVFVCLGAVATEAEEDHERFERFLYRQSVHHAGVRVSGGDGRGFVGVWAGCAVKVLWPCGLSEQAVDLRGVLAQAAGFSVEKTREMLRELWGREPLECVRASFAVTVSRAQ